jgi:hypothetical protein
LLCCYQTTIPARAGEIRIEATAEGEEERVKELEAEIDNLLREKQEVEKWATLGSA